MLELTTSEEIEEKQRDYEKTEEISSRLWSQLLDLGMENDSVKEELELFLKDQYPDGFPFPENVFQPTGNALSHLASSNHPTEQQTEGLK